MALCIFFIVILSAFFPTGGMNRKACNCKVVRETKDGTQGRRPGPGKMTQQAATDKSKSVPFFQSLMAFCNRRKSLSNFTVQISSFFIKSISKLHQFRGGVAMGPRGQIVHTEQGM